MTSSAAATTGTPIPAKATGSHFYRYSEFSGERKGWLKEIILSNLLYIPTIAQLNDPTDGRPRVAAVSEDQLFHFLYDGPCGVLGRNPRMPVEQQIIEGVALDNTLRYLGPERLQRMLIAILHEQMENGYRVYSLSKRFDNLNLWAKYAGKHMGYCLEFVNSETSFVTDAKEVIYGDAVPMDITNREQQTGYWLFCKRQEWSNEEEVRVLGFQPFPPNGKYKIQPDWISRVILGYKMPEADKALIREWASQRQPRLSVVDAHFDNFDQALTLRD